MMSPCGLHVYFSEILFPLPLQFKFTFSRKRRHFGSPCVFSDRRDSEHPEGFVEIASSEDPNYELQRMEMEVAVQVNEYTGL